MAHHGADLQVGGNPQARRHGVRPRPHGARRLGHHYLGPEHLLGLLREANEPIGTDLPAQSRRERVLLSLPDHGPHPIKLLVEGQGLTLGGLQAAVLERGA